MEIPVYLFTGFLDAGKSTFVQSTLEDKRFNGGERTLLLMCEEGECEYDPLRFSGKNIHIQKVDEPEQLTCENLSAWLKSARAKRVLIHLCYFLPALSGACLLIYAAVPHLWFVYNGEAYSTMNVFQLQSNAWDFYAQIEAGAIESNAAVHWFE